MDFKNTGRTSRLVSGFQGQGLHLQNLVWISICCSIFSRGWSGFRKNGSGFQELAQNFKNLCVWISSKLCLNSKKSVWMMRIRYGVQEFGRDFKNWIQILRTGSGFQDMDLAFKNSIWMVRVGSEH